MDSFNSDKAAIKEGLKRAQGFGVLNKSSGVQYFCTTVDMPNDTFGCLTRVMEGVNKDKKASEWGKVLLSLSSDETRILGIAHLPEKLATSAKLTVQEWIDGVAAELDILSGSEGQLFTHDESTLLDDTFYGFVIRTDLMDPDREIFAFKLCDEFKQKNIDFLKAKGLIPVAGNNREDDIEDYSEAAGIVW